MNSTFLRIGAALATAVGAAAGVIAANPALVNAAFPPTAASAISVTALVIVAVLHELVHNSAPAAAPADPAQPKESP